MTALDDRPPPGKAPTITAEAKAWQAPLPVHMKDPTSALFMTWHYAILIRKEGHDVALRHLKLHRKHCRCNPTEAG
jgi:hypothetical protein